MASLTDTAGTTGQPDPGGDVAHDRNPVRRLESERPARTWDLWFGLLAGHVAWSLQLMVAYFFAWLWCLSGATVAAVLVHGVTIAAGAVTLAALVVSYRSLRLLLPEDPGGGDADRAVTGPAAARRRSLLMALAGVALSGLYLFVLLLSEVANFVVPPCG